MPDRVTYRASAVRGRGIVVCGLDQIFDKFRATREVKQIACETVLIALHQFAQEDDILSAQTASNSLGFGFR